MIAGVHQAVAANIARTKAEGTDRWADLLKTMMPAGLVRDAILASPAWPDIAAAIGRLDARGVDVARILVDVHAAGAGRPGRRRRPHRGRSRGPRARSGRLRPRRSPSG